MGRIQLAAGFGVCIAAAGVVDTPERAVCAVRSPRLSRIGFLGHTHPGMLDMYSDFTMVSAQAGGHVGDLDTTAGRGIA